MKEKIGAPKGRQLCGAPKWALIMPNSVGDTAEDENAAKVWQKNIYIIET